jgi:hypothetical protein
MKDTRLNKYSLVNIDLEITTSACAKSRGCDYVSRMDAHIFMILLGSIEECIGSHSTT